ncbi:MAG TPA: FmdB family zinc ribbon protein [Ktedonobacterales bacterium]
MPTYEYSCRDCGAHFDAWQKITDDPIEVCPTCGGSVRRIVFPVGLMFKGSGFYSTDNRGSSVTPPASSPSATASEAGEKKSSSETTTAAATSSATGGSSSGE